MKQTLLLLITGLLAAVTPAATALNPGTYTLSAKGTYTLAAKDGETAEYTLTTNGNVLAANLEIDTNTSGTVILTLQNFSIRHARPIFVDGSGTVIFKTAGTTASTITHNTGTWENRSYPYVIGTVNATLRFQLGDPELKITTTAEAAFDIVPVSARDSSVFIESGTLRCTALSTETKYAANFPLTPAIRATAITLSGETTTLVPTSAFRVAKTGLTGTTAHTQSSPFFCTTFTCTGGTIRSEGTPIPDTSAPLNTGTVYAYPDASFNSLIKQAQGGTILNKKIFHFPGWTPVDDTDYSACFANAEADALTVNPDARTIAVDLSTSPKAEPVYTADSCADAATLFGADAVPTSEGLKVAYAFGITRIGAVAVESELAVSVRLGVRLPKETADTATFLITVTDDAKQTVYQGNTLFTRLEGSDLFETADLATSARFADLGLGTAAYTVTAREATTE